MKEKIEIKDSTGKILYKGNLLDMPIKDDYIIKRSIEIFNDDDPCIIHKSYVIKKIAEEMLKLFENSKTINFNDYKEQLNFIKLDLNDCILIIGG